MCLSQEFPLQFRDKEVTYGKSFATNFAAKLNMRRRKKQNCRKFTNEVMERDLREHVALRQIVLRHHSHKHTVEALAPDQILHADGVPVADAMLQCTSTWAMQEDSDINE